MNLPDGVGPQFDEEYLRRSVQRMVGKSPTLAAPYGTARRAVLDRAMPIHLAYQGNGGLAGTFAKAGSIVMCTRVGRRTWHCYVKSPQPGYIEHAVIANTRDLTFRSSITNRPYKLVGDMQFHRSWQQACRGSSKIRWARRILGQALHNGEPSIWHSSVQRQVDELIRSMYTRVGVGGADELLRTVSEHRVSAARKSAAMCGLTGEHDLWKPDRHRGDGYAAGVIQKRIEAFRTLTNMKELLHAYAR